MSAKRFFACCTRRRLNGHAVDQPWPPVLRRLFTAIALLALSGGVSATTAMPEPDATGNYSMSDIVDVLSAQSRELEE